MGARSRHWSCFSDRPMTTVCNLSQNMKQGRRRRPAHCCCHDVKLLQLSSSRLGRQISYRLFFDESLLRRNRHIFRFIEENCSRATMFFRNGSTAAHKILTYCLRANRLAHFELATMDTNILKGTGLMNDWSSISRHCQNTIIKYFFSLSHQLKAPILIKVLSASHTTLYFSCQHLLLLLYFLFCFLYGPLWDNGVLPL